MSILPGLLPRPSATTSSSNKLRKCMSAEMHTWVPSTHPDTAAAWRVLGHLLIPLLLLDHLGIYTQQTDGYPHGFQCPAGRWRECSRPRSPIWLLVYFNHNACGSVISVLLSTVPRTVSNPQRQQWVDVTASEQHTGTCVFSRSICVPSLPEHTEAEVLTLLRWCTHEWGQVKRLSSPTGHSWRTDYPWDCT